MFRGRILILLLGDLGVFAASLFLTLLARYGKMPSFDFFTAHLYPFSLIFIVWLLIFYIAGLYSKEVILKKRNLAPLLFTSQLAASFAAALFFYLLPVFKITPRGNLLLNLLITFVLLWAWRQGAGFLFKKNPESVLLVAVGTEALELAAELKHASYGLDVTSHLNLADFENRFSKEEDLLSFLKDKGISLVIADISGFKMPRSVSLMYWLNSRQISVLNFGEVYADIFARVPLVEVSEEWVFKHLAGAGSRAYLFLKRLMDVVTAFFLGIPSLFLFPLIALAIKLESRGPVFFRQNRVGKNGRIFSLLKYRSTYRTEVSATQGWEKEGEHIYTKTGRFLRKTYLDELPQFINILKGEMSFIGPRPERPEFVRELSRRILFYHMRLLVPPGLTGWAQINMQNDAAAKDAEEKLKYDFYYIKNLSLFLDLRILLKTVATVLSRSGR